MAEVDDSSLRRVLVVLYSDGVQFAIGVDWPAAQTLTAMARGVIAAIAAQEPEPLDADVVAATCAFFSWDAEQLPFGTTVSQVPEPGVVIAVDTRGRGDDGGGGGLVPLLRRALLQDETYGPRVRRFLRSPDAVREPAPLFRFDAFVSYSALDGPLAAGLVRELGASGVVCFLAEIALAAGRLWADQLHRALLSSRAAVILLTPRSVHSEWVQVEAGAMWALRRPVLPTLAGLAPADVPASVRALMPEDLVLVAPSSSTDAPAEALARTLVPLLLGIRETGDGV